MAIEAESLAEALDLAWDRAEVIGHDWWEGIYSPDYYGES
jgi:hypothetical protein